MTPTTYTPSMQAPAPTAMAAAAQPLQRRIRQLASAWGESETTVRLLMAAALLLTALTLLALAALAVAPHWVLGGPQVNAGSARVLHALVGLLLWLSLMGLFGAAWTTGAFDSMLRTRWAQALCIGLLVTAAVWLGGVAGMPGLVQA